MPGDPAVTFNAQSHREQRDGLKAVPSSRSLSTAGMWMQLLLGWLPIGTLLALLVITAHAHTSPRQAVFIALRMMITGAALGFGVYRYSSRFPWPQKFTAQFVGVHILGAAMYAMLWILLNSLVVSIGHGALVLETGAGIGPFLILGVWIYATIAGVCYATQATNRAVHAEALAARAQLDALRGQLNPHFLFNALHTVVQLIPIDPARAVRAAEEVAGMLRVTIEEDRDVVTFADEWRFVQRYLAIEALRFADRLRVETALDPAAMTSLVPSYALQTLVENAVRHGATPNIAATTVSIRARLVGAALEITVRDDGVGRVKEGLRAVQGASASREFEPVMSAAQGSTPSQVKRLYNNRREQSDSSDASQTVFNGTGLQRLRQRLLAIYGPSAQLILEQPERGFGVRLVIPQDVRHQSSVRD